LSILLVFICIGYRYFQKIKFYKSLYLAATIAVALLLVVTGHQGGSLTHGSEYLALSHLNPAMEPTKKVITDINRAVVYEDLVQPIINQRCVSCHSNGKKKGGLLLDSYAHLLLGGESGKAIVKGNSKESEFIKLVTLNPGEERAMPPKGKTPLTKEELAIIKWWIDTGADEKKTVAQLKASPEMIVTLTSVSKNDTQPSDENTSVNLPEVASILPEKIDEISSLGLTVVKMTPNSNLLDVRSIIQKKDWNDSKTEKLVQIKDQVYILDLSNTAITNKALTTIGTFKMLRKLDLNGNNISDENFAALKGLQQLEYLNIYNTQISDQSIPTVSSFKNLKKLYLWKSKISAQGIEALKKALPNTDIVGGEENKNT
ncbi:MAG TPA: c-type cytochrome domain-containing protein, partial [Cytophagaceae bacterium]